MRGTVAKRLRREIYRDMAIRNTIYVKHKKTGRIEATDLRQKYQRAKKRV